MSVIQVEYVSNQFAGGLTTLDRLSLDIFEREILTIVGTSGCGKSTLLRMIAGLDVPSSGHIRIDGQSMENVPARDRNVAMVFQSYALYPHMTCYENLALNLRLRKLAASEIEKTVHEIGDILTLTDL